MRAGHLVPAALVALLISGCGATSFAETVAQGPAYPLRAAAPQGFDMDFNGFDEPQRITAPRDPLDLSRLGG